MKNKKYISGCKRSREKKCYIKPQIKEIGKVAGVTKGGPVSDQFDSGTWNQDPPVS